MTEGEKTLCQELREFKRLYGVHVRKQVPIGPYIADFAIQSAKLINELDGQHHFSPEGLARDQQRDDWFDRAGYRIIRINTGDWSDNADGCIETILHTLGIMK
jgi:very-short-patch-repair endonuclease